MQMLDSCAILEYLKSNLTFMATASAQKHSVVIYSTPTCGYCHMAKDMFAENNIAFMTEEIIVNNNSIPTIVVDEKDSVI